MMVIYVHALPVIRPFNLFNKDKSVKNAKYTNVMRTLMQEMDKIVNVQNVR